MVQRHDLSARHSGVLQRRQSSTTPIHSAGFAEAVPLPLASNAPTQHAFYTMHAKVVVVIMQELLMAKCRRQEFTSTPQPMVLQDM